jgi:hypothetical protein
MIGRTFISLSLVTSALAFSINCAPAFEGKFKLAALNTTLPNANSTGIPLVVAEYLSSHPGRNYPPVYAYSRTDSQTY